MAGRNRKDLEAMRERDRKAGIIRFEVRIPAHRKELLKRIVAQWRKEDETR